MSYRNFDDGASLLFSLLRNEQYIRTKAHIQLTGAYRAIRRVADRADMDCFMRQALMRQAFAHCARVHAREEESKTRDAQQDLTPALPDAREPTLADDSTSNDVSSFDASAESGTYADAPDEVSRYSFRPDVDQLRGWSEVARKGFRRALCVHPIVRKVCAPLEKLGNDVTAASRPLWGLLLGQLFTRADDAADDGSDVDDGADDNEAASTLMARSVSPAPRSANPPALTAKETHTLRDRLHDAKGEGFRDPRNQAFHWFVEFLCVWLQPSVKISADDDKKEACRSNDVAFWTTSITPDLVRRIGALVQLVQLGELPSRAQMSEWQPAVLSKGEIAALTDFVETRDVPSGLLKTNAHLLARFLHHQSLLLSRRAERRFTGLLEPAMRTSDLLRSLDVAMFEDRGYMALKVDDLLRGVGHGGAFTPGMQLCNFYGDETHDAAQVTSPAVALTAEAVAAACGASHRFTEYQLRLAATELDALVAARADTVVNMLHAVHKMKQPPPAVRRTTTTFNDSFISYQMQPLNALYVEPHGSKKGIAQHPQQPSSIRGTAPRPETARQQRHTRHQAFVSPRLTRPAVFAEAERTRSFSLEEVMSLRVAKRSGEALADPETATRVAEGGVECGVFAASTADPRRSPRSCDGDHAFADPVGFHSNVAAALAASQSFHVALRAQKSQQTYEVGSIADLRPLAACGLAPSVDKYRAAFSQEKRDFRVRQRLTVERHEARISGDSAAAKLKLSVGNLHEMVEKEFARELPPRQHVKMDVKGGSAGTALPHAPSSDAEARRTHTDEGPAAAPHLTPAQPPRPLPTSLRPYSRMEMIKSILGS